MAQDGQDQTPLTEEDINTTTTTTINSNTNTNTIEQTNSPNLTSSTNDINNDSNNSNPGTQTQTTSSESTSKTNTITPNSQSKPNLKSTSSSSINLNSLSTPTKNTLFNTSHSPSPKTEKRNKKIFSEYFRRYELLIEYKNLSNPKHCPSGVYVLPSEKNFHVWKGIMFLSSCGKVDFGAHPAVVKFVIEIPQEYPSLCPEIRVLSPIYHPLIDVTNGKVDLRHQFQTWRANKDHICHLLHYFKKIFLESTLQNLQEDFIVNRDVWKEYKTNPTKFAQTVKSWGAKTIAELSNDYDDEALKLVDISPADYKKAHDELFGQNKTFFTEQEGQSIFFSGIQNLTSMLTGV